MPEESNLSVRTAAIRMGCTLTHVYNLVRTQRLAGAFKRDGQWLVPECGIAAYRERLKSCIGQSRTGGDLETARPDQAGA
ncbi:MAG TPA: hypothetical protein VGH37_00920 [Candidatus Acidoferrum sp.]|jgi:hypothetical protein